jgi:iron complex outermembrane receptor protein
MTQSEKKIPDVSELPKFKPSNLIATSVHRSWTSAYLVAIAVAGLSATASATLEEVVVTARKTAESLQDTPISVTALSGDRLEDMGLSRITKLQNVTPNLVFQNTPAYSGAGNNAAVYIRGVGQKDFVPTIDPGVGIYVDEVYLGRSAGAVLDMIDIQQVEILRGPQGTLFGKNTIGGAISITTTKPNEEFGGKVDIKVGTDERRNIRGVLNLPLSDTLFARGSFGSLQQDGYVFRPFDGKDLGNQDTLMGRLALRWVPSDTFTADLSFDYYDDETNGPPLLITRVDGFPESATAIPGGNFPFINNLFAGFSPDFGGPNPIVCTFPNAPSACFTSANAVTGNNTNLGTGPNYSEMENEAVSLTLTWDLDAFTAKLITSYRSLDGEFANDRDGYPQNDGQPAVPGLPILVNPVTHYFDTFKQDQFSVELQLTGSAIEDRLSWVAGVYAFEEDGENINPVDFTTVSLQSGGYFDYSSEAVFAQATFDFTQKLSATAGIRYTKEDRDYLPDQYIEEMPLGGLPFPCFNSDGSTKICALGDRAVPYETVNNSISESTPMVSISYSFTDDVMLYGTYSEGFKVGGFTQRIFPPEPSLPAFGPEYVDSLEAGIKAELLDNSLRVNLAVYSADYSDLQILISEPSRVGPYTTNAGDATIDGFELEINYLSENGVLIDLAVGYTDAGYDSLNPDLFSGLRVSDPFVFISEWNTNLSVTKTFDTQVGEITPRLDWSWRSEFYTNAGGLPFAPAWADPLVQPDYSVVNMSARWESATSGLSITVGVDNVADEEFSIFGDYQSTFGSTAQAFDRGRQYYLMLGYSF